jgi:hypothetical protein
MRRVLFLLLGVSAFSAEAPLRVLFLGNSYTYYNHLAGLVEGMARAAGGRLLEAASVTRGGATLEVLYTSTNALEALRGSRWDVVVLQEQSTLGLNQFNGDMAVNLPAAFFTWARIWDAEIRRQGARTVFLNTWARKRRGEQQAHLDWAYATIARELGAGLIPAGSAFQGIPDIDLFQPDGSHPSAAGSYLAACAAVETLIERGCASAPAEIPGVPMDNALGRLRAERGVILSLPEETAVVLRAAALATVQRLRAEGGYWHLARPVFAGDPARETANAAVAWEGRWEGATWLYGRKANATLQLAVDGMACSGTWSITALDPVTQTTLPLTNCAVGAETLRFVVKPLFFGSEIHEVHGEGAALQGRVTAPSMTPYARQGGTWTLQRAAQ